MNSVLYRIGFDQMGGFFFREKTILMNMNALSEQNIKD